MAKPLDLVRYRVRITAPTREITNTEMDWALDVTKRLFGDSGRRLEKIIRNEMLREAPQLDVEGFDVVVDLLEE